MADAAALDATPRNPSSSLLPSAAN